MSKNNEDNSINQSQRIDKETGNIHLKDGGLVLPTQQEKEKAREYTKDIKNFAPPLRKSTFFKGLEGFLLENLRK